VAPVPGSLYARKASDALAAIAIHRGSEALRYLSDLADAGPVTEIRKDAIFWLGQVRIGESSGELERLMFRDDNADIRQHAAFSLAQSNAPDRGAALIRQVTMTRTPRFARRPGSGSRRPACPRAKTRSGGRSPTIATKTCVSRRCFALSQLPDERNVDALFAVLRNNQLPEDVRKQALFWLAQSDSERAYEYLDGLLTRQ
jgi:HEAT repeat protein